MPEALLSIKKLPAHIEETLVYEHPGDVQVGTYQQLVERLEVIMPEGDVQTLGIPGALGEHFDETRFSRRREAVLQEVAAALEDAGRSSHPPSVLGRFYALWTHAGQEQEAPREGLQWRFLEK